MRRASLALASLTALTLGVVVAIPARAEMWCADPLWVHEWGVVVFGATAADRATGPALPAFFHAQPGAASALGAPVRGMPIDGGERELPVVHFYAPGNWRPVPVALEVGFARGEATRWFPQVDGRRTAAAASSPQAQRERAQLIAARRARGAGAMLTPLGRDPTRQLAWDHLVLEDRPSHAPQATTSPWVRRLRDFADALWVNGAAESERFVFYEGRTRETSALRIERGPTYAAGRRHYVLHNTSPHPIHDVFVTHRDGTGTYVLRAPSIPAGRSAGFVLEEHRVPDAELAAHTRMALRDAMIDPGQSTPPSSHAWGGPNGCVMQRDPAIPVERAVDHRLYAHEADAIVEIWGARAFDAPGTTILYREDTAQLDEAMPLSIYTNMYHFVVPHRLGLALVEHVALP